MLMGVDHRRGNCLPHPSDFFSNKIISLFVSRFTFCIVYDRPLVSYETMSNFQWFSLNFTWNYWRIRWKCDEIGVKIERWIVHFFQVIYEVFVLNRLQLSNNWRGLSLHYLASKSLDQRENALIYCAIISIFWRIIYRCIRNLARSGQFYTFWSLICPRQTLGLDRSKTRKTQMSSLRAANGSLQRKSSRWSNSLYDRHRIVARQNVTWLPGRTTNETKSAFPEMEKIPIIHSFFGIEKNEENNLVVASEPHWSEGEKHWASHWLPTFS